MANDDETGIDGPSGLRAERLEWDTDCGINLFIWYVFNLPGLVVGVLEYALIRRPVEPPRHRGRKPHVIQQRQPASS